MLILAAVMSFHGLCALAGSAAASLASSRSSGGGFGLPHERSIEAVQRDVSAGYVSERSAFEDYGLRFNSKGEVTENVRK